MNSTTPRQGFRPPAARFWIPVGIFLAVAGYFLWQDHRLHILGVLSYLLLLACPLLHLFMHRGHNHGGGRDRSDHEP